MIMFSNTGDFSIFLNCLFVVCPVFFWCQNLFIIVKFRTDIYGSTRRI